MVMTGALLLMDNWNQGKSIILQPFVLRIMDMLVLLPT